MTTLGELARTLGGVIRTAGGDPWLDTKVGELRAVVIGRPRQETVTYDIGVYTPGAPELDPTYPPTNDQISDGDNVMPRLRHGYVYIGCRGGVLYATPVAPPSLECIIATMWELAQWARARLSNPPTNLEDIAYRAEQSRRDAEERREKWRHRLSRLGVVAGVVAVVTIFRRFR